MDTILVINAGSSSVKFEVFSVTGPDGLERLLKGQVDGIATRPRLHAKHSDGHAAIDRTFRPQDIPDVAGALQKMATWLHEEMDAAPIAVGHRVVHGGPEYDHPVLIDEEVVTRLERYVDLAPLHQPHNLAPIRALRARVPQLPQVACFDTAFHRGHSPLADHFALPRRFYAEGVRRYGFHGLSYEFIAGRMRQIAPDVASGKVIAAHLGSGASMCALADGRSVESSMGFTALDGLPMGTRPGQLDAGVVLHLILEKGMTAAAVQDLLYHDSGLKGLSGISNDMRELEASSDPWAIFAVDFFAYRIGLYAGMLAAALGGLDAFVFTAGIGENSVATRARVADKLAWLGAKCDAEANRANRTLISHHDSRIALYVVPTDEELMIARHTLALLSSHPARRMAQESST